jgi:NADH dehydrogenase [ubiquinone] 1 alpha subcomplex assembly factor 7
MSAHLRALIRAGGPLRLDQYMAQALTHPTLGYYATREPFGEAGDFITAPEVSQMFGELIGVWCAHTWESMGSPPRVHLVEMGPGRATLMKDLLRASAKVPGFADALDIHLVEVSQRLQNIQRDALSGHNVTWHQSLTSIPDDAPLLLVANELLDALPIRQFQRTLAGWCERLVDVDGAAGENGFCFVLAPSPSPAAALIPAEVFSATIGAVAEVCPGGLTLCGDITERLQQQGGAALLIDYGADTFGPRDTLQAIAQHKPHPALETPGQADLSAHVDFSMLARAASERGAALWGPTSQGDFLIRLGIAERAAALRRTATDAQHKDIDAALERLVGPKAMGSLFKVLCIGQPDLPQPAGFST